MKLEPVYLVAPAPAVKAVPTRRALLWAATSGFAGLALGSTLGATLFAPTRDDGRDAGPVRSRSQPDPRVLRAFELARTKPSDATLLAEQHFLVSVLLEHSTELQGRMDVWSLIARIMRLVVDSTDDPDRRQRARALLDLGSHPFPPGLGIEDLLPELRHASR